jgi:hypothetical protein
MLAVTHTDQQTLYAGLYKVLQREKVATLTDLEQVYGLGSADPSLFALDLVSRLGLPEACEYLRKSEEWMQSNPPGWYKGPDKELKAAIDSLRCK